MTGEAAMRDYSNDDELLKLKESVEKLTGATAKRFVVQSTLLCLRYR